MSRTKRFLGVVLSAALCGGIATGAVQARELRYAVGQPPGSFVEMAAQDYADAVEKFTNGELQVKVDVDKHGM